MDQAEIFFAPLQAYKPPTLNPKPQTLKPKPKAIKRKHAENMPTDFNALHYPPSVFTPKPNPCLAKDPIDGDLPERLD